MITKFLELALFIKLAILLSQVV